MEEIANPQPEGISTERKCRRLGGPTLLRTGFTMGGHGGIVRIAIRRLFAGWPPSDRGFQSGNRNVTDRRYPGADSEFYLVETRLKELGVAREAGETLSGWINRMEAMPSIPATPLRPMLLH